MKRLHLDIPGHANSNGARSRATYNRTATTNTTTSAYNIYTITTTNDFLCDWFVSVVVAGCVTAVVTRGDGVVLI